MRTTKEAPAFELKTKCRSCNAEVIVEAGNIRRGNFAGIRGETDYRYFWSCSCRTQNVVPDQDVPEHVRAKVPRQ